MRPCNCSGMIFLPSLYLFWDDLLAVPVPGDVSILCLHVNVELRPVVLHHCLALQLAGEAVRVFCTSLLKGVTRFLLRVIKLSRIRSFCLCSHHFEFVENFELLGPLPSWVGGRGYSMGS